MPLPTVYDDGTATFTNGSDQLVGQDTTWRDLQPGDVAWSPLDGVDCRILSIEDDEHATLAHLWAGATTSADPYEIRITPDTARMQEQTRLLLETMTALDANTQGIFSNFVTGASPDADPGDSNVTLNDTDPTLVDEMYLDDLDANNPKRVISGLTSVWAAGTSIIIRSLQTTAYAAYRLNGPLTVATGYKKALAMDYLGHDGVLTSEPVSIAWFGVGEGLAINAVGNFAGRAAFNGQATGFTYLSTDGDGTTNRSTLYRKNSGTSGDWSAGAVLEGEQGEIGATGATGSTGAAGTNGADGDSAYQVAVDDGFLGTESEWLESLVGKTAYQIAVDEGFGGDEAAWLATLIGDSAYDVAVAEGFVGDEAAWLLSIEGASGDAGADGTDPGVLMIFDDAILDANPFAGGIRGSDTTLTDSDFLYISKTNRAGDDIAAHLLSLADSTSPIKGLGVITRSGGNAQTSFDITGVTDATGYVKVAVENGAGATGMILNDIISFQFYRSGDNGADGLGTGTVVDSGVSVAGNLAMYADTSGLVIQDSGIPYTLVMTGANNGSEFVDKTVTLDALHLHGSDIASASTVNLETATGAFVDITGTVTTTVITLANGHQRKVRAAGAWPITVGANLVLNNGGSSYTCAAGDIIDFVADGTVIRGTIHPISGQPLTTVALTKGGTGATTAVGAHNALHTTGADIASAATVNLETATGAFVDVTGTVTTTAITLSDGHQRLVRAAAAWPITIGASLTLNGVSGGTYTCTAGDLILFIADGSVVRGVIFPVGVGFDSPPIAPQGRPTLTTLTPVTESDVTGATNVYFTPCDGNGYSIYDGNRWGFGTFAEQTLPLDSTSGHTGYHQSGKAFCLWLAKPSGTLRFGTGPAWSSDISTGTGAGTSEIEIFEGRPVNKVTMTLRYGSGSGDTVSIPARQAVLVGGFYATANGQTEDSVLKRMVSSVTYPASRPVNKHDNTNTWTYSTAAFQQFRATAANQVEWFNISAGRAVDLTVGGAAVNSVAGAQTVTVGVGIDSTSVDSAQVRTAIAITSAGALQSHAFYTGTPGIGRHIGVPLEMGAGSNTQTWIGDLGLAYYRTGIVGLVTN